MNTGGRQKRAEMSKAWKVQRITFRKFLDNFDGLKISRALSDVGGLKKTLQTYDIAIRCEGRSGSKQ